MEKIKEKLAREEGARAGENDDPDLRVRRSCRELSEELGDKILGECVSFLGPVECEDPDAFNGGGGFDEAESRCWCSHGVSEVFISCLYVLDQIDKS